jgi:hypothetical protein
LRVEGRKGENVSESRGVALNTQPSTLNYKRVVLDHGVAQEIAADLVDLVFAEGAVEFEFDHLANAGRLDGGHPVVLDRVAHGHALRVEDALLRHDDDFGFHRRARIVGRNAGNATGTEEMAVESPRRSRRAARAGIEFKQSAPKFSMNDKGEFALVKISVNRLWLPLLRTLVALG